MILDVSFKNQSEIFETSFKEQSQVTLTDFNETSSSINSTVSENTQSFDSELNEEVKYFTSEFGEVYELVDTSEIPIPGRTSELENDSGFLTEDDVVEMLANNIKIAKIGEVTLLASAWKGSNNLYRQVVEIEGVTENSQVDLTPNVQQLAIFYEKDLSFVTENDGGIVTVYVIGQKPDNDYTMQVTITEVVV